MADLLTETALFAEDRGRAVVGVAHLLDHVDAMEDGHQAFGEPAERPAGARVPRARRRASRPS